MPGNGAYRVGLTGGIGSGKSTVARWLAEQGFLVVDADRLVAELYEPGAPGALAVRSLFGSEALASDGRVDHRWVAQRIFSDAAARQALEQAIHPLVRSAFAQRALGAPPGSVAVLEATLLVEAGYAPDFDLVVAVEAEAEERLRRAIARGMSEAEARSRLAAQGSGETRRAGADVLLDNDGTLEELRDAVESLAESVRERAAKARD